MSSLSFVIPVRLQLPYRAQRRRSPSPESHTDHPELRGLSPPPAAFPPEDPNPTTETRPTSCSTDTTVLHHDDSAGDEKPAGARASFCGLAVVLLLYLQTGNIVTKRVDLKQSQVITETRRLTQCWHKSF